MDSFDDLKDGDLFSCTLEFKKPTRDIETVTYLSGEGIWAVPKEAMKDFKILPQPIQVGDTVHFESHAGANYKVLGISGDFAWVCNIKQVSDVLPLTISTKNLRRI